MGNFLQTVRMLVISVGNVGNGKQYVLQTVQMVIISVDKQFSAKSTDVAISCQKIQMLSISVSD